MHFGFTVFKELDTDLSGALSKTEFTTGMAKYEELLQATDKSNMMTLDEADALFNALDSSGDGEISLNEFKNDLCMTVFGSMMKCGRPIIVLGVETGIVTEE